MSEQLTLSGLPNLPQLDSLHTLVPKLWQRSDVLALWLAGSFARGNADRYSDVDLYIGVRRGSLEDWHTLDVAALFGEGYAAHYFSIFSEMIVFHVFLTAGRIVDLHIEEQGRQQPAAKRLVLICRDEAYRTDLTFTGEDVRPFATSSIDPDIVERLVTSFWMNVDKNRKILYRDLVYIFHSGLFLFRQMALRLIYMDLTDEDCGDLTRPSIHGLKSVSQVFQQEFGDALWQMVGKPSMTIAEMCEAYEVIYAAVSRTGRSLAAKHNFTYPDALETIVRQNWQAFKADELAKNV